MAPAATAHPQHVRAGDRTRSRAVQGYRAGWIRPPKRSRAGSTWPGDVAAWSDEPFDAVDIPAWINGRRAISRALIHRLAFAEASMLILAGTYALMLASS